MDVTPASPGCLTGLLSFKRLAPAGTGKVETRPSPTIDLHNAEAAAAGSAFRRSRLRADPVSSAVVRLTWQPTV